MRRILILFWMCMAAACVSGREAGEKLLVATTIDFLDYAFADMEGAREYYDLETYERRIREIAEGGIKKIYLRVNACGATNYPTLVSQRYGTHGRIHWAEGIDESHRFSRTLDKYDNLAETIRLGHKYGMEVWAWDSLNDDGGVRMQSDDPKYQEDVRRLQGCPLMDASYFAHPEWQAQRNPGLYPTREEAEAINARVMRLPVARIVICDSENVKPEMANRECGDVRVTQEEVEIYLSDDNRSYRPYAGEVKMRCYRDGAGRLCCELSGLNISSRYVKLCHPTYQDERWTIAVRKARGDCKVFNAAGEELPHCWGMLCKPEESKLEDGFDFDAFSSCAWDYQCYQLGFALGCLHASDEVQYYGGFTEFAVPDAMAYRLRKFAEIANYPFDGFMINTRSHSRINLCPGGDPDEYGFNPDVRAKTIERCGKDPVMEPDAVPVMRQIRAEAIADYLKGCKALIGKRPLYLAGISNRQDESNYKRWIYGKLPWLYSRYFKDGSVDGVMMMGVDFRDELTPDVLQGRKIKLGVFREMGYPPRGYDFKSDLEKLRGDEGIDEVELYETLVLTQNPKMFEETRK